MRALIFVVCFCIVSVSFAAETKTECPWMKEQDSRSNPKANLQSAKEKINQKKGASAQ
jgi:hypothetical protein